jgi:diguanylate cyclase
MKAEGRCWLIVGTMCGEEVQGKFALKYKNCTECDIYKDIVYSDPVSETYEHLFTLLHSVRTKEQELKALAIRDALTGLHNRHYFDIVMSRETGKVNRHGGKLSIVMIDINKFKMINDTYGHLHGDGILKEFAAILSRAARSSDILVRFGGDEFIIAMPETDCSERGPLIARINNHLAAWNDKFASNGYRLSFSIGCALFEKGKDLAAVIREADARMYEHKLQCS